MSGVKGKSGRPREYKVGLVDKGEPNAEGIRVLILACDDGRGTPTRWRARCDADGRVRGKIRLVDQDRISRHAPRVRAAAKSIARMAMRQLELPIDLATGGAA